MKENRGRWRQVQNALRDCERLHPQTPAAHMQTPVRLPGSTHVAKPKIYPRGNPNQAMEPLISPLPPSPSTDYSEKSSSLWRGQEACGHTNSIYIPRTNFRSTLHLDQSATNAYNSISRPPKKRITYVLEYMYVHIHYGARCKDTSFTKILRTDKK